MAMQLSNKRCTGIAISKKAATLVSFSHSRCSLKKSIWPIAVQPSNKRAKTSSCYISRWGPWLLHHSWTSMAYLLHNIHMVHRIYNLRNTFFYWLNILQLLSLCKYMVSAVFVQCYTWLDFETQMSSFWQNCVQWLQRKLTFLTNSRVMKML